MSASLALMLLSLSAHAQDKTSTAGTAGVVGGDGVYRPPFSTVAYRGSSALTYTLAGPLKWHRCTADHDGDCLNDAYEDELAALASPFLLFDADEECGAGTWELQAFHQVRPRTGPVALWQDDGTTKTVAITYFFNYPLDCGHGLEGDHMGDSEHIVLTLEGEDLRTWRLIDLEFFHHGTSEHRNGQWLRDRAAELGIAFPTVLVEDDKHGSWWGDKVDNDHCAGSEDNYSFGATDCLDESLAEDLAAGRAFLLDTSRNIGEPPSASADDPVVSCLRFLTDGYETGADLVRDTAGSVYTELDLGLGLGTVREYWWKPPAGQERFCGWTCANGTRDAAGDCPSATFTIASGPDSFEDCATGLPEKVDTTAFDTTGIDWCAAPAEPAGEGLIERLRKLQVTLAAQLEEEADIVLQPAESTEETSIYDRYPDLLVPEEDGKEGASERAGSGKNTDLEATFDYHYQDTGSTRSLSLQAQLPDGALGQHTTCTGEGCATTVHYTEADTTWRWDCTLTAKGVLSCSEG